ncbi:MAG: hypothetical protein R2759_13740 [Bacteroidales bacterium]
MDKRTHKLEYFDAPKPKFPVKWLLIGIAIVIGAVIGQSTITLIFIVAGLLVGGIPIFSYMKAKKR